MAEINLRNYPHQIQMHPKPPVLFAENEENPVIEPLPAPLEAIQEAGVHLESEPASAQPTAPPTPADAEDGKEPGNDDDLRMYSYSQHGNWAPEQAHEECSPPNCRQKTTTVFAKGFRFLKQHAAAIVLAGAVIIAAVWANK